MRLKESVLDSSELQDIEHDINDNPDKNMVVKLNFWGIRFEENQEILEYLSNIIDFTSDALYNIDCIVSDRIRPSVEYYTFRNNKNIVSNHRMETFDVKINKTPRRMFSREEQATISIILEVEVSFKNLKDIYRFIEYIYNIGKRIVKLFVDNGKVISISFYQFNVDMETNPYTFVHFTCEELYDLFYKNPSHRFRDFMKFIKYFYGKDEQIEENEVKSLLDKMKR